MIMTAELNSHQRVSYYTGVKLIRHHQSASTANPNNNNNNSTSNTNNNSNIASANSSTAGSAFFHQHPNHYPPHPPHHHHHHQQHPPPLPPHHPGHFHLPCPTGPPHIQHPGGVLHLNNHHAPPHHHPHPSHHQYGGGGSNQATRLYTGSPLIRSTGYHSSSSLPGGSGGGLGNSKRTFKCHQHRNNHIIHNNHHGSNRSGGIGNPSHYHNQSIIGGSCSSGTSSSSSSNEHLNNIQSPTSSPITQAKLDISPLKLSSSPVLNGESSSSNNSSPGPQSSPSPSTASNLSTSSASSSPNSTDGNKDLDHFYFLDEHWKPSSDGSSNSSGVGIPPADILDISSSGNCARWTNSSSGSPSPHTVTSATASTTLTMMVDQFFANGHNNNFGSVDGNNNFIGINRDGLGGGLIRDSNNNIIGGQQPDFNEIHLRNDRFHNSFNGLNSGNNVNSSNGNEGASGLFNFGPGAKFNGIQSSSSTTATTVVNVETQIGTFNGQRDLEIRLCFIKGDNHGKAHRGSGFGETHQSQIDAQYPTTLIRNVVNVEADYKTITVIGDPFKSSAATRPDHAELQSTSASSSDSEMDNKGTSAAVIRMPMPKNKEITQHS